MKKLMYSLLVFVLLAVAFAFGATHYDRLPDKTNFDLDLDEIRGLLANDTGAPVAIGSLSVAAGEFPGCLIITGCGTGPYKLDVRVFQLQYSNGRSIVIDPPHDKALNDANELLMKSFNQKAFDRMQLALIDADKIVFTHEHFDHMGGVVNSPNLNSLLTKLVLNSAQLANADQAGMSYPESMRALTPLNYEKYHHLAPGVVLIKAAGHTPGAQMIFVRMADGKELLFAGDTAWNKVNILEERTKPLITNWVVGEDGVALANQIRALIDLHKKGGVTIVLAHDVDWLKAYEEQGLIQADIKLRKE